MVAVFPEIPNPFYLEMNTLKAQEVKIQAEAGWGSDCQNENQIRIEVCYFYLATESSLCLKLIKMCL